MGRTSIPALCALRFTGNGISLDEVFLDQLLPSHFVLIHSYLEQ